MLYERIEKYVASWGCKFYKCQNVSTYVDSYGHHWCESHIAHGLLLSTGDRNGFPCLCTGQYALGEGYSAYLDYVKITYTDAVLALLEELRTQEQEELAA